MYDIDKKYDNRLAPKLTDTHIMPTNFERMKVCYATQILSATVAAALRKLVTSSSISSEALVTSDFVLNMNDLFDMFNSSTLFHAIKYKQAFSGDDYQIDFLSKMKTYLNDLTVFTEKGIDISKKVKVFKYWYQNISSLLTMWNYLRAIAPEIKYLFMRRFNQDSLENFFGKIRSMNGNAFNPTPIQLYYSFQKLFSVNYSTPRTGNCQQDNDVMLSAVINFAAQHKNITENKVDESNPVPISLDEHDYRQIDINEQDAFRYICGYLMKKCLKQHSCDLCLSYSKDYVDLNDTSYYCFLRAYSNTNDNIFGNLCTPNNDFVEYIKILEDLFFQNIEQYILQPFIIYKFVRLFKQVKFTFPCPHFPQDYLIKLFARVRLFYTLKFVNKRFKSQNGRNKIIILRHD